ncbi:MAG: hypothetical protein U0Q22_19520 [Acidimicrobiales bacterium]
MSCDWSLVDGDPAPGHPDAIRKKGDVFTGIADVAKDAYRDLKAISGAEVCEVWEGQAAERFADTIEQDFLTSLSKLDRSFHKAGHALQDYATELSDLQEQAKRELDRACRAEGDEREGERRTAAARSQLGDANDEVELLDREVRRLNNEYYATLATRAADDATYDQRYQDWRRRMDASRAALTHARDRQRSAKQTTDSAEDDTQDARRRLAKARDEVADIRRRREQAERDAAHDLDEATKLGIRNKSLWEQFKDGLKEFGTWVLDNLEVLDKILDIVGTIVTIATIICAIVPCLQVALPFLAAASVVISVTKATISVVLACAGRKDWGAAGLDVLVAALDVVTLGGAEGGKGATALIDKFPKLAKAAKILDKVRPITDLMGKAGKAGGKLAKLPAGLMSLKGGTFLKDSVTGLKALADLGAKKGLIFGLKKLPGLARSLYDLDQKYHPRADKVMTRLAPPLPIVPPVRIPIPIPFTVPPFDPILAAGGIS